MRIRYLDPATLNPGVPIELPHPLELRDDHEQERLLARAPRRPEVGDGAWQIDHGRRFNEWAASTIAQARGRGRGPFSA